jgi:hypothetical protein
METRNDILKELQEIAPKLALLEKTNPYKLPEGYFLKFKDTVLQRVQLGDVKAELNVLAPELSKIKAVVSEEEVPATYFSSFSEKLLTQIRLNESVNELHEIAPELAKLEKVNAFEVPANYFNALPQQILGRVQQQSKAAVPASSGWVRSLNELLDKIGGFVFQPKYSVAFAGVATSVIMVAMLFSKTQQCNDFDCKLAQLSNDEINNYIENKSDVYSDEIFEMNLNQNLLPTVEKDKGLKGYKEALKDVDDAALDAAIAD